MLPFGREAFILLTLLLNAIGIGLVAPVLPRLVETLSGGDLSLAGLFFGPLNSIFAGAMFLCSPALGRLSDRFGRRPVILLALAGSVANYAVCAAAPSLTVLFMARLVGGICGGNGAPAAAYLADVTSVERRTSVFGLMGAAYGLGLAVGPALGGLLGSVDLRLPFEVAAALAAGTLLLGCLVLPESLPASRRRSFALDELNPLASLLSRRRPRLIRGILAGFFFYAVAQSGLQATWVLFTERQLGWNPTDIGLSLTVLGVVWMAAQVGLTPIAVRHLGERTALVLSLAVTVAAYLLYGCVDRGWEIYAVTVASALAFVAGPAARGVVSRAAGDDEQGELQGAIVSVTSLAAIVGPSLGGWAFGYFTSAAAPLALPGAAFFLGALLNLLALGMVVRALSAGAEAAGIPVLGEGRAHHHGPADSPTTCS
jgi:DHA1 family tetracycline resistance protein-like MFS transporter